MQATLPRIGRRLPYIPSTHYLRDLRPQCLPITQRRCLRNDRAHSKAVPDFAFAFDIDGVLLRSSKALPRAKQALSLLRKNNIPFILLTNGGGKYEDERVADLSHSLEMDVDKSLFIQSHTPFEQFQHLKDKNILVMGGDGDKCRRVAENYGFRHVIVPGDIINAYPAIWPFSRCFHSYYQSHAKPLPQPIAAPGSDLSSNLQISAVLVFHDPRDWALDTTILLDLLLSHAGYLGTRSALNGNSSLPNNGYQQDGQPALIFSNSDLFWAAEWHQPRLGQGGFQTAFEGVWRAATDGAELKKDLWGKPFANTYAFAEKKLVAQRSAVLGEKGMAKGGLRDIYMIGDNPESDIRGANAFESPTGAKWRSLLVKTGVYEGGEPKYKPDEVVEDVWDAVQWGLRRSGWE